MSRITLDLPVQPNLLQEDLLDHSAESLALFMGNSDLRNQYHTKAEFHNGVFAYSHMRIVNAIHDGLEDITARQRADYGLIVFEGIWAYVCANPVETSGAMLERKLMQIEEQAKSHEFGTMCSGSVAQFYKQMENVATTILGAVRSDEIRANPNHVLLGAAMMRKLLLSL